MPLRIPVAVAAALLLLAATVAPAQARGLGVVDARHDVWAASDATTAAPAPEMRLGDIARYRVDHSGRRVLVRVVFLDLARRGRYAQYVLRLQASGTGMTREIVLETAPGSWAGRVRVFKPHGDLVTGCAVRHSIDYTENVVVLRVDRRCLRRPGSVRANLNASWTDGTTFWSDNAQGTGAGSGGWSPWVRHSR